MPLSPASGPGGGGGIPQGGPLTADLAGGGHGITGVNSLNATGSGPFLQAVSDMGGSSDLFLSDGNATGIDLEGNSALGLLLDLRGASTQYARFRDASAAHSFLFDSRGLLQHVAAAPADSYLSASDFVLWLDDTPGATKLMVKAKDAGGTVRTAAIALT